MGNAGSISYDKYDKLGEGGDGTVYRGTFGKAGLKKRIVAVKVIPLAKITAIEREAKSLMELDNHENVIRYYHTEEKNKKCYIALELAVGTLEDYVKGACQGPDTGNIGIIAQATEGLKWLHSKNIIHRDVKPSNILLVEAGDRGMVTKLSDFGLSKELSDGWETTFTGNGTRGWMAPELLSTSNQRKSKRDSDVFALGCVVFYVLANGKHPFGEKTDRDYNIIHTKYSLSAVEDVTSKSLVEDMIQQEPKKRPTAADVLSHPFFWEQHTKISFIQNVSDRAKSEKDKRDNKKDKKDKDKQESPLCISLEEDTHLVFHGTKNKPDSWKARLGDAIGAGLDKSLKKEKDTQNKTTNKGYDDSAASLLRLIRNKMHHFEEVPEEACIVVGKTKEEFMEYITKEIPCLVLYVWRAAFELKEDSGFKKYYKSDFKFSLTALKDPTSKSLVQYMIEHEERKECSIQADEQRRQDKPAIKTNHGVYPMTKTPSGMALIISNIRFNDRDKERKGGESDEKKLKKMLEKVGFTVKIERNLTSSKMDETIAAFTKDKAHETHDMAVLAVMTHGGMSDGEEYLSGVDSNKLKKEKVIEHFYNQNAPLLAGKPKWLLFQACRGKERNYAVTPQLQTTGGANQVDGGHQSSPVDSLLSNPTMTRVGDLFLTYSTIPNYVALRHTTKGAWLIQVMCEVFDASAHDSTLTELHTLAHDRMESFENGGVWRQTINTEQRGWKKKLYFKVMQ